MKPNRNIGGFTLKKYMEIGILAIKHTNIAFHDLLMTA